MCAEFEVDLSYSLGRFGKDPGDKGRAFDSKTNNSIGIRDFEIWVTRNKRICLVDNIQDANDREDF